MAHGDRLHHYVAVAHGGLHADGSDCNRGTCGKGAGISDGGCRRRGTVGGIIDRCSRSSTRQRYRFSPRTSLVERVGGSQLVFGISIFKNIDKSQKILEGYKDDKDLV